MELFTFLHVGGTPETVEILLIGEGNSGEATLCLQHMERSKVFDASECQCFDPEDKKRLLDVIRESFGSIGKFNKVVAKLLTNVGLVD